MALRFRSKFEQRVAVSLKAQGIPVRYEATRIKYQKDPSTYTPDFELPNGIFVETKGRFIGSDRAKHLLIQQQHPELDIRFVFQNAHNKLTVSSKTTYAQWCDKNGFKWAQGSIPQEWIQEKKK